MTSAEDAYMFRHGLLRDAAYDLQPPADRGRLHLLALEILEALMGGPPPGPERDAEGESSCAPHAIDEIAAELAQHVRAALESSVGVAHAGLAAREILYSRRAAERASRRHESADSVRHWQRVAELAGPEDAAGALRRAGTILFHSGKLDQACAAFASALELADGLPTRGEWSLTRLCQALVEAHTGQWDAAESGFAEVLEVARSLGYRYLEARVLGNLSSLMVDKTRYDEAVDLALRALEVHRELGKRRSEGVTLSNLGTLYLELGRMEEAEQRLHAALEIHRQTGNRRFEGLTLGNLAKVQAESGRPALAEQNYQQSVAIQREVGFWRGAASVRGNFAGFLAKSGRLQQADEQYTQALQTLQEAGDRRFQGIHSCGHACCLIEMGQIDRARHAWSTGRALLSAHAAPATLERHTQYVRAVCEKMGVEPITDVG